MSISYAVFCLKKKRVLAISVENAKLKHFHSTSVVDHRDLPSFPTRRSSDLQASMKFSIVTISYNQDRFLQETIDSIRVSAPHELQYVIVDPGSTDGSRSEEHTSELQSHVNLVCRLLLEKKKSARDFS